MRLRVILAIILLLTATACAARTPQSAAPKPERTQVSGITVVFDAAIAMDVRAVMRTTLETAIALLPERLADEIRDITIYVADRAERCDIRRRPGVIVAACANGEERWIEFIGWAPVSTILHEIGHIVGSAPTPYGTTRYASFIAVYADEPIGPTAYGRTYYTEDFADSFAYYILHARELRERYPIRYAYFKNVFGIDYAA